MVKLTCLAFFAMLCSALLCPFANITELYGSEISNVTNMLYAFSVPFCCRFSRWLFYFECLKKLHQYPQVWLFYRREGQRNVLCPGSSRQGGWGLPLVSMQVYLSVQCCLPRKCGSFSPLYREVFIIALVSFIVLKT